MNEPKILLAIVGIVALIAIGVMILFQSEVITGQATASLTCSQVCATPTGYTQCGATNQKDCLTKCNAKGSCTPIPTTSTGMINVRRIKQVASIL